MGSRIDALVLDLCGADTHPLAARLRGWAQASRAVAAFLEANASKVRRKLRVPGPAALADVEAELAVAAWLLRERRWTLAYEPLAASGGRGPDFRVAAPDGSGAFFVEVTRLRDMDGDPALRLARALTDKVGQLPAGAVNVVAAVLPSGVDGAALLADALRRLDRAAGGQDGAGGLDGRAFARGRPRLGAVLLADVDDAGALHADVHLLPGARHQLPPETVRRLRALG
ncbi:hypothetical protein HNQ07_002700 [Deinococcus metalli]|uniref:Uncharacterized protein n=1 Tax=Deinococcus metalli TaxID=1141878 RepID=A0A7W8NSJ6_9DEIO|nr:hypothetical protein [Deinococcus metalli]MBB5377227.1 hypothetical protein [Deinococcus metalli]GHF48035.1 hypothetical protein GCM10017781_25480 [Deinococcus metalli]